MPKLKRQSHLQKSVADKKRKREQNRINNQEIQQHAVVLSAGSFHQGHFGSLSAGRQCTCNCLIALAYKLLENPLTWNTEAINSILVEGDKLYRQITSHHHQEDYLMLDELPTSFQYLENKFKLTLGHVYSGQINSARNNDPFVTLRFALQNFTTENTSCFLIIQAYAVGLMSIENGHYLVFDPHSRNQSGMSSPQGTAVLVKCISLEALLQFIQQLTNSCGILPSEQFELVPAIIRNCNINEILMLPNKQPSTSPCDTHRNKQPSTSPCDTHRNKLHQMKDTSDWIQKYLQDQNMRQNMQNVCNSASRKISLNRKTKRSYAEIELDYINSSQPTSRKRQKQSQDLKVNGHVKKQKCMTQKGLSEEEKKGKDQMLNKVRVARHRQHLSQEEREKRRQQNKQQMAKHRQSLSQEERQKQQKQNKQQMSKHRQSLSQEERQKQQKQNKQQMSKHRQSLSQEERQKQQKQNKQQMAKHRQSLSQEERQKQQNQNQQQMAKHRQSLSQEERQKQQKQNKQQMAKQRKNLSQEERQKQKQQLKQRMSKHRQSLSQEERQILQQQNKKQMTKHRQSLSQEERQKQKKTTQATNVKTQAKSVTGGKTKTKPTTQATNIKTQAKFVTGGNESGKTN